MPSRMIESKKKYVLSVYTGTGKGMLHRIKCRFYEWRISRMTDGEILDKYYELTAKEPDDFPVTVRG